MNWVHPASILLVTWVTAFAQAAPFWTRWGLGVQPDFLPALIVYSAFTANLPTTAAVALLAGLSYDALSSGPFGLTLLPCLTLGVLLHRRRDIVLWNSVWSQASLGLVATGGVTVATLVLLWIFSPLLAGSEPSMLHLADFRPGGNGGPDPGLRQVVQWVMLAIGGAVATPVAFRFFGWVDASFNYRPVAVPVNRGDREIKRGRS